MSNECWLSPQPLQTTTTEVSCRSVRSLWTVTMTHIGAIEKVSHGEQCGEDVAESLVLLQLFHALFQILQRLCNFLSGGKHTHTSLAVSIKTPQKHVFLFGLHRCESCEQVLLVSLLWGHEVVKAAVSASRRFRLHSLFVCVPQVSLVCVCVCVSAQHVALR